MSTNMNMTPSKYYDELLNHYKKFEDMHVYSRVLDKGITYINDVRFTHKNIATINLGEFIADIEVYFYKLIELSTKYKLSFTVATKLVKTLNIQVYYDKMYRTISINKNVIPVLRKLKERFDKNDYIMYMHTYDYPDIPYKVLTRLKKANLETVLVFNDDYFELNTCKEMAAAFYPVLRESEKIELCRMLEVTNAQ